MEETKNFLDILSQELEKLQEDGVLTEEQLQDGITMYTDWMNNEDNVYKADINKIMTDILKEQNSQYASRCKYFGRTRNKPKDIVISQRNGNTQIKVNGNDDWSKFIITNRKSDKSSLFMITPEEFGEKLLPIVAQRKQESKEKFAQLTGQGDLSGFSFDVTQEDINGDLEKIFGNLMEYYRYLQEIAQYGTDKTPQEEELVGVIKLAKDEGTTKQNVGESKARVNDIMSFEERDTMFRNMNPINVHKYLAKQKDGQLEPVYTVYVYNMLPKRQGALMVCEPYRGDKLTRTIYLPSETMSGFLLPNQEIDAEYWKDTSTYYLNEMSNNDFRKEDRTCMLEHTSPEKYKEFMEQLIIGESTGKGKELSVAGKTRLKRVCGKLFEGEKSITNENIEGIISVVSIGELEEVMRYLKSNLQKVQVNDTQDTERSAEEDL